jgi:predicted kinase
MGKLILTRGVPASGKSTWAKAWVEEDPLNRVRVNRDNLRWTLGVKGGVGDQWQEEEVTHWQNQMITRYLSQGKDVVVDNTNLRARHVKELIKLGQKWGAEVEFKDFPDHYAALQFGATECVAQLTVSVGSVRTLSRCSLISSLVRTERCPLCL